MKKSLKRILILATVLLLICAGVVIAIVASDAAKQSTPAAKLEIVGSNLSFSDSVYLKYAVSYKNVAPADVKLLIWTTPQTEYVKGTELAELSMSYAENVAGKESLVFDYKGLAAKQMTDNVYARVYVKIGDNEYYSEPHKYSILKYAYNKMGKTGSASSDAKLVALLEDMLNYGALAQKYTGYKTDALATDEFAEIKLQGGLLADGFNHGLYKVGTTVSITAPAASEDFAFVGWRNTAGEIVSTNTVANVTVGAENEYYVAIYQGSTSNKLEYVLNSDGKTYSVSGIGACTDENIVIPSVIGGKLVTAICDSAFKDCANIKSVTFTANIGSIGADAFSGCTSLTTIYFDGVKSQWTSLIKGANWDGGREDIQIIWNASDEDWGLGGVPLH